jgi:amino acid transporter
MSSNTLKKDSIGIAGIVFFVLAFAAPLTVIIGLGPIVLGKGGSPGAPAVFVLTTVTLLVFAVGFAAMSRKHAGPGGFAVYIGRAFGERAAQAASYIAVVGYNCMITGGVALLSATTSDVVGKRLGVDLDWRIYAAVFVVAIAVLGYREVAVSVRILSMLLVAEVLIVFVLDAAVVVTGGAEGIHVGGFAPSSLHGNIGTVFLMAFAAFVGFEATALFAEEAKDSRRTIPRATYIAVASVGTFYALTMWCIQMGWGSKTAEAAGDDPVNFLFDLNTKFVGHWSSGVMQALVITSIFAALLSTHGALSRYLFAMGRSGMLPGLLGTVHPRMKSPHIASLAQSAVTATLVIILALTGADPIGVIYPWILAIGSVAILILYVAASLAVCKSLRASDYENRLWVTTIAPMIAAVAMSAILVLAVSNYDSQTGSSNPIVNLLWVIAPIAGVIGWLIPRHQRKAGQDDLEAFASADVPEAIL